jgi:hypothetical protein
MEPQSEEEKVASRPSCRKILVYLPPHAHKESGPSMPGVVNEQSKRAKNSTLTVAEDGSEMNREGAQQAYRPAYKTALASL